MHDPRVTPARGDVAAKHLEGQVAAERYVEGESCEIADALAPVRLAPTAAAEQATQALKGERFTVYDRNGEGWAWGQLETDGYVGWIADAALAPVAAAPTHKVTALCSLAFPGPSIKLPPSVSLPMEARLVVARTEGLFAVTKDGWYVPSTHLAPVDAHARDFVAVAEGFVGTPYLWGGKSSHGIDCSGLVQLSLHAAGRRCPRDSDMQSRELGRELGVDDSSSLQRGDLLFWRGHVAIARDAGTLVHANAFHMATAIEATQDAIARIKAGGSDVIAIRRL